MRVRLCIPARGAVQQTDQIRDWGRGGVPPDLPRNSGRAPKPETSVTKT